MKNNNDHLYGDFKSPYRKYAGKLILSENIPTEYQNVVGQYQQSSATELLSVRDKIVEDCNKYTDSIFTTTVDKLTHRLIACGIIIVILTCISTYYGWLRGFQSEINVLKEQLSSITQENTILSNKQQLLDEKIDFILKHVTKD